MHFAGVYAKLGWSNPLCWRWAAVLLGNIPKDELREYHEGMLSDPFAEVNLVCPRTKISKKALSQSFDAKKSH